VTTTTLNLQNAPTPTLKKTSTSSDALPVTGNNSLHLLLIAICLLMLGTGLTSVRRKIRT
jgi:LPXTG-motif cell wall-anchored protein